MNIKSIIICVGAVAIFSGCEKDDAPATTPDTDLGYVSFTNVNSSSKVINVFVDDKKINGAAISVNTTMLGTYTGLSAGSHSLQTKDTSSVLPPIVYYTGDINIEKGKAYSFFQYGVLTGGALRGVLLNSDNKPDLNGNAKVRFLNISNNAPALDFVMVRREGTVEKDSVVLYSNMASLGSMATPDVAALSPHKLVAGNKAATTAPVVAASSYNLKVKLAGTNTLVSSAAGVLILPARNYTFYLRGNYPSVALSSFFDY
jgi:hypothetical protein